MRTLLLKWGMAIFLTSVASPIRMVSVFMKIVSEISYVPGGMYTTCKLCQHPFRSGSHRMARLLVAEKRTTCRVSLRRSSPSWSPPGYPPRRRVLQPWRPHSWCLRRDRVQIRGLVQCCGRCLSTRILSVGLRQLEYWSGWRRPRPRCRWMGLRARCYQAGPLWPGLVWTASLRCGVVEEWRLPSPRDQIDPKVLTVGLGRSKSKTALSHSPTVHPMMGMLFHTIPSSSARIGRNTGVAVEDQDVQADCLERGSILHPLSGQCLPQHPASMHGLSNPTSHHFHIEDSLPSPWVFLEQMVLTAVGST